MTTTQYFVVPAPGHYGNATVVVSSHRSLAAAKRAASTGFVVRVGSLRKGAEFVRADEQHYPMA